MSDLRKILGLGENTTIYDINDVLKTKTYEELNQLRKNYNIIHPDDKINIVEDLHYRRVNGKLALNELVVYYNELYSNRKDFNARVKKEQIKFAQDFLDYGVKIYYDGILSSFIGSNHGKKIIESIMNTDDASEFTQQWFQNNKLIIAKTKDGKTIQSGEIVTDDAIINPLLLLSKSATEIFGMAIFSGSETVALLVELKITFPVTVLICISLLFFLLLTGIFKIIYFVIKLSFLYKYI